MENSNDSSAAPVAENSAPDTQGDVTQNQEGQQTAEAQAAKNLKRLKLKVDGQEIEEEIDLNDEETLKRHLQMSKAAQKRMSEAAKARQQAEQLVKMFQGNIKDVLKQSDKLGKKPEDIRRELEEYFAEQLEEELLSPEQRKLRDAERIIREREEETKRAKEAEEAKFREHWQNHYAQEYDRKITEALSTSGLPKTPKTVRRMAELMSKNLDMGLDLEPKQLVDIVREDYLSEIKELFSSSDGDTLLKLLGDDVANKIRKSDLARLKAHKPTFQKQEAQAPRDEKPAKRMSTEEWLAEVRRRAQS